MIGEILFCDFFTVLIYITKNLNDQIKIRGTYDLKVGDHIRGKESGTIATVSEIVENKARFKIDYSLRQDKGWNNNIGKLNDDAQVIPNNDYYQSTNDKLDWGLNKAKLVYE